MTVIWLYSTRNLEIIWQLKKGIGINEILLYLGSRIILDGFLILQEPPDYHVESDPQENKTMRHVRVKLCLSPC